MRVVSLLLLGHNSVCVLRRSGSRHRYIGWKVSGTSGATRGCACCRMLIMASIPCLVGLSK